jgi:hypothetical protein
VAKAQIVVDVGQPNEVQAVDAWFDNWRSRLTFVSGNTGCGCCVNIWEVEGPIEALHELPEMVVAYPGIEI